MSSAQTETQDDVTIAIGVARAFLSLAFQNEAIENVGLEEVRHLAGTEWDITLGFNRKHVPVSEPNTFLQMAAVAAAARPRRIYKVVRVDLNGPKGISISNRADN